MFGAPEDRYEKVSHVQPDSVGRMLFSVCDERLSVRSRNCLDPRNIRLKYIIESGAVIDPGQVSSILNPSDPAELDSLRGKLGENLYSYLLDHKDEIRDFYNGLHTK